MVHFIWACNKIKKMFVENTISIYASNVVFFIMLSFFCWIRGTGYRPLLIGTSVRHGVP